MKLKHVALYSKNWYKRTDIWEDLKKCLEADCHTTFSNGDVISIITRAVVPLFSMPKEDFVLELLSEIRPQRCWKYGYYTKDCQWLAKSKEELPDYDYDTAILYFFLSRLSNSSLSELDGLPEPSRDVLPLRKD